MTEELGMGTEPEAEEKVPFGRTGFFRDGTRRIDLVLVVKDDGNSTREAATIEFLTNLLKFGLCLELEPGLMIFHRNLVFIKIHAPETLIEEYGRKFEVRRYFKQSHIEFVRPTGFLRRLISYIDYTGLYEREWIKLVRRKYPQPRRYSTIERSTIVHKLLSNLPFGDHENYVGYNSLLRQKVIMDAFPLHDGPYFAVPGQFPAEYNARQILNYNWAGLGNLLKFQPLNLIHEYFGDRLAFLFAFYGFYTISLIIPALISTDAMLPSYRNFSSDFTFKPYYKRPACPLCKNLWACRFMPAINYHIIRVFYKMFDSEYIDVIMIYIVIWATLFVLFWRRKEYYWMWMWECKPEISARTVRPEYIPDKQELGEKKKGVVFAFINSVTTVLMCILTLGCYVFLWVLFAVGIMLLQDQARLMFNPMFDYGYRFGHYKVLIMFYLMYLFIIVVLEKVLSYASYTLTNLQNHRTDSDYESSLVLKLFGFTYPFICTLFFYIAFFKQHFYTNPLDIEMYNYWGIFMSQCNPDGCCDELALSLFVVIIMKECVFKLVSHVHALFFMRTDYNQGKSVNINVPCWEREYTLTSIKEDFVIDKLKSLAIQFGLSVGFICGCPMTLFFIICTNLLDIRITAKRLVKGCRRPLLQNNVGIGTWKKVFIILIFATIIINSLILTMTVSRFRNQSEDQSYSRRDIFNHIVMYTEKMPRNIYIEIERYSKANVLFFNDTDECVFPRGDNRRFDLHDFGYDQPIAWYRRSIEALHFNILVYSSSLIVIILFYVISPKLDDIERTKAIEKEIIEGN